MKTFLEILPMIDENIMARLRLRALSKEEFLSEYGEDASDIYEHLQKSKCGLISVEHTDTKKKHYGITAAFGEGLSCYMSNEDRWFTTSVIKHIDKDTFETLNSVYKYNFEEMSWRELYFDLQLYVDEGKNKKAK